jgi:hypothetical protein
LTTLAIKTLFETGCFGIHDIIEPIAAQRHTFTEKNDLFVAIMHYIGILLIVQVIYSAIDAQCKSSIDQHMCNSSRVLSLALLLLNKVHCYEKE